MSKKTLLAASTLGLCLSLASFAQAQGAPDLSLDDFVPPVAGGPTEVQAEVSEDDGVVVAETAQDGLNHAYQSLVESGDDGIEEVVVPSGYATISVASADYRTYDNRNATLLSKRAAYTVAMARAQKQLVENVEGLTSACERSLSTTLESRDAGTGENRTNVSTNVTEQCREDVKGVLNGYVVYAVKDNAPEEKTVTVALASSTKTQQAAQRVGGALVLARDKNRAWDTLMAEITSPFAPPVGAVMMTDPDTGENIIVGYGSAIIRSNADPSTARKLQQSAERQAQMRANNALVSFLVGDEVYWTGGFEESQVEGAEQFEYLPAPQPADSADTPEKLLGAFMKKALEAVEDKGGEEKPEAVLSVRLFETTRDVFLNTLKQTEEFNVITKGQLPPGVRKKAFVQENGDWATAIAVFSNSMSPLPASAVEGAQAPGQGTTGGVNENAENPAGPTGQPTTKQDL
jgi:hypothetical protein